MALLKRKPDCDLFWVRASRDNGQTGNDSETSDDLMGGVINASHRRAVQHNANQNQMIEE